jgi:hypothetical protein
MTDVVLSADEDFERLREAVWRRLCARDGFCTRERFDEAYAEWWTREVERAAHGKPSRAAAPVAFVAESVHRVLIDDARARARGLSRDEKNSLEILDLDSQVNAAAQQTTADQASYEALVHRVLTLVQGELTDRELRVFVFGFLYMKTTGETARALGLSTPRVKKDREKIARKIGERVWEVLSGELDLCAAYDSKQLGAIFELLSVHVEDCPTCSAALGGVRSGALVVVPPAEILALSGSGEGAMDALSHAVDSIAARFTGIAHRVSETMASMPPGGRTAAAVAVAASAVAGGAVTVTKPDHRPPKAHERAVRKPPSEPQRVAQTSSSPVAPSSTVVRAVPTAVAVRRTSRPATTQPTRAVRLREQRARQRRIQRQRRARATPTPETREAVGGFEQQAPAPATAAPSSGVTSTSSTPQVAQAAPPASRAPKAPAPSAGQEEFGIESP